MGKVPQAPRVERSVPITHPRVPGQFYPQLLRQSGLSTGVERGTGPGAQEWGPLVQGCVSPSIPNTCRVQGKKQENNGVEKGERE